MATTLTSTISAFAGSVIRPATEALVDWARPNVNDVRRMKTKAANRRTGPNLTIEQGMREANGGNAFVSMAKKSNSPIPQKSDVLCATSVFSVGAFIYGFINRDTENTEVAQRTY